MVNEKDPVLFLYSRKISYINTKYIIYRKVK